jgi:prepilin-type N-terminal cleavage/methylation domain-containing protein
VNRERGLTIIELTIVLAIISILAAITFPLFAGLKDKATWGAAKGNLGTIRSALASYAANDVSNKYPASMTWNDLSSSTGFMRHSNLPDTMEAAKMTSMVYSAPVTRNDFTIVVTVRNKFADTLRATPRIISPDSYPH